MSSNPSDKSPEYWLMRAAELREHSAEMKDPVLKLDVEQIAKAYERLAVHIAERWPKNMELAANGPQPVRTSRLPRGGDD